MKCTRIGEKRYNCSCFGVFCEDEVKLLGVTFDFKLTFNSHVSHICKKASQQLNVLKRIGNNLSKLGKLTIYYSFILSNLTIAL